MNKKLFYEEAFVYSSKSTVVLAFVGGTSTPAITKMFLPAFLVTLPILFIAVFYSKALSHLQFILQNNSVIHIQFKQGIEF